MMTRLCTENKACDKNDSLNVQFDFEIRTTRKAEKERFNFLLKQDKWSTRFQSEVTFGFNFMMTQPSVTGMPKL